MTIQNSAVEELRREIELFLNQLKLGMEQVNKLVPQIMQSLQNNKNIHVTTEALDDKDMQKQLRATCLTHVMQDDPKFKFDPKFKIDPSLLLKTPDELEKENKDQLKNTFKDFLKKMFKLTPKNKKKRDPNKEEEEKIDELAETLERELTKNKKDVPLGENKPASDLITSSVDVITADIETKFGVDIRQTCRLDKPVPSTPVDVSTQNFATEEGTSFMASLKQQTGDDPSGIKIMNMLGDLADGGQLPPVEVLRDKGILPEAGFNPQLKPFRDHP